MVDRMEGAVLEAREIYFSFSDSPNQWIIDGVSFKARKGEFISLIGPSGCGKSTLLRVLANLIKPSSGEVLYNGKRIYSPTSDISFVFQDFALLPWLTNIENVEVGLATANISPEEKRKRAAGVLNMMGLESVANYYPNALSGGMKQRVGIARAIVSNPRVLLMDEPFSSLDELTANALRSDVVYMLKSTEISINSVIMVTHNVEEAVEMSDRIIVLTDKPTKVKEEIKLAMEYPRNRHSRAFITMVDKVYEALTRQQ
ncbi:MAG: ABC transporter ATP-binding protein [Candidatus Micrarchaeaceae archaeon]